MTPQHPYRTPLKDKILLGTLFLVLCWGAAWLAKPDANAAPWLPPTPGCHTDAIPAVCDPTVWLLGEPPVPVIQPRSWEELMLPPTTEGDN